MSVRLKISYENSCLTLNSTETNKHKGVLKSWSMFFNPVCWRNESSSFPTKFGPKKLKSTGNMALSAGVLGWLPSKTLSLSLVTALWDYISLQYTEKWWLAHSILLRIDHLLPANLKLLNWKYKSKTSGALEGKYTTLGHLLIRHI